MNYFVWDLDSSRLFDHHGLYIWPCSKESVVLSRASHQREWIFREYKSVYGQLWTSSLFSPEAALLMKPLVTVQLVVSEPTVSLWKGSSVSHPWTFGQTWDFLCLVILCLVIIYLVIFTELFKCAFNQQTRVINRYCMCRLTICVEPFREQYNIYTNLQ